MTYRVERQLHRRDGGYRTMLVYPQKYACPSEAKAKAEQAAVTNAEHLQCGRYVVVEEETGQETPIVETSPVSAMCEIRYF